MHRDTDIQMNMDGTAAATTETLIPITIIPRPDQLPATIRRLEEVFTSFTPTLRGKADALQSVAIRVARDHLNRLRDVVPFVDFICVACMDEVPSLDDECLSVSFEQCGGKVYSPTAERHRGVMSGTSKSDAAYAFTLFRKIGGRPVTWLLQEIREKGKTSLHYHRRTTETFLSLFGEAFIYMHDRVKWGEGVIRKLIRDESLDVAPETTHQLITTHSPAVNLLLMDNFDMNVDPELKDHIYQEECPGYRSALESVGIADRVADDR